MSTLAAEIQPFSSAIGSHVFVVDGSRVYDVDAETAARVAAALTLGSDAVAHGDLLRELDLSLSKRFIGDAPPALPELRSISLNVAQACNMGCHYCYADEGRFGGSPRRMEAAVAFASIDRLIAESRSGARLVVGFMGGEPLLNRDVVHAATRYAAQAARAQGREIAFSITTNATLVTAEDAALFRDFPFTVQVSIDGDRDANDAARPMRGGGSSYARILAALDVMNRVGRPQWLAARVTVTPRSATLSSTLDHLIALGFDEVGFAAVVSAPSSSDVFDAQQFDGFLAEMTACGAKALSEYRRGRAYPFSNFETALREIHRGTHRPYACGAGAAYLSANAEGDLFACHRFIDDSAHAMGNVYTGSDVGARTAHLAATHVDRIKPCRTCWARYLCGGGCQHEVTKRGRIACDYIRGWLQFCLRSYVELQAARPEYFAEARMVDALSALGNVSTLAE